MFMLFTLALASTGQVSISWNKGVRALVVEPPPGQDIAPEAPVDLSLRFGDRTLATSGEGAWLLSGVDLGRLHGPVEGQIDLQLCDKESGICAPASWHVRGLLPDSKKGALALQVSAVEAHAEPDPFNVDVNPAVDAAYAKAVANGDHVLLDFSAIWCPPCNALAAEVLHAPDAEVLLKGFQVAVVDVDHISSWPIKSKYAVEGYPTVVITDAQGNELERIEGYAGKAAFLDRLANLGQTSDFDQQREAFQAAPTAEGLTALLDAKPTMAVEVLMENKDWALGDGKPAVLAALPGVLAKVPATIGADVLWFRAKLEHEVDRPFTYAAAAALLKASFRDVPADRAYYTFYGHLLADAGELDTAVSFLDRHTRENPDDPTFLLSAANLLLEHHAYDEALRRADLAAERSWGDILLRVEEAACKALVGLERTDDAQSRARAALDGQDAPAEELVVRTHKYRERLKKFLE